MIDIDYKLLGENIQRIRRGKHVSQMELAELSDLSPVYVSLIECSKRKPSLKTVVSIADALSVTVDELLADPKECDALAYGQMKQILEESGDKERMIVIEISKYLSELLKR